MASRVLRRKSGIEKYEDPRRAEVKRCPKTFADIKAGQLMVLPMPRDIEAVVRQLKSGTSLDMRSMIFDTILDFLL